MENQLENKEPKVYTEDQAVGSCTQMVEQNGKSFQTSLPEIKEIDDNVQAHRSNLRIYSQCLFIALGSFYIGYVFGVLNLAQPTLNHVYGLEDNLALYSGMLQGSVSIGAFIGCFGSGYMMQMFGERKSCIISDIVGMVLALLCLIPNYYVCLVTRVFCGVIVGLNSNFAPYYIRQITPVKLVGKTGSFYCAFLCLGLFISYAVGMGFPFDEKDVKDHGEYYWRFVMVFPLFTCALRMLALLFVYKNETAQYYISKNNIEMAKKVVDEFYLPEYQEQEYQIIKKDVEICEKTEDTWAMVFAKENRQKLKLGCILQFLLQNSGITAVTLYSSTIFLESSGDQLTANLLTLASGALFFCLGFVSGEVGKHFGRKKILVVGNVATMITLGVFGTVSLIIKDQDPISKPAAGFAMALVFLYIILFNLSSGTFVWVYNADILFGKSLSLATSFNWFFGFIQALVFPIVVEKLGIYAMFFMFAVCLFFGVIYMQFNLKETRGLNRNQIDQLFSIQQDSGEQLNKQVMKQDIENLPIAKKLDMPSQATISKQAPTQTTL